MTPGDEALPDARAVPAGRERVAGGVPAVEVADDGDGGRVGGPDGEVGALAAVDGEGVGAELVPEPEVAALLEEVDVPFREEARAVDDVRHGVPGRGGVRRLPGPP